MILSELWMEGTKQLLIYLKNLLERCRQIGLPELSLDLRLLYPHQLVILLLQRRIEVLIQYFVIIWVG